MQHAEQSMYASSRDQRKLTQIAFWSGLIVMLFLSLLAVTEHNPLSRLLTLQSAVFIVTLFGCRLAGNSLPAWVENTIVGIAIVALFIHCATADLPITSVAMEIVDAQVAAEVVVVPVDKEDTVDPIPDWLSPRRYSSRLNYILKQPIVQQQRALKFRFARTNRPYHIKQISYGTDFFRLPFALVNFSDDRIEQVAKINRSNNQLDRISHENTVIYALSNKIRSKPAVMIPASEGFVRQNVKSRAEIQARLIWFLIHLAVILFVWKCSAIVKPFRLDRNPDDSGTD